MPKPHLQESRGRVTHLIASEGSVKAVYGVCPWLFEYFTLPHTFQADPNGFQAESEWNGRNGRNLVGMKC